MEDKYFSKHGDRGIYFLYIEKIHEMLIEKHDICQKNAGSQ
jgi:hypothetical protein